MKKPWIIWIVATLLVATVLHVVFMFVYPQLLMTAAMNRLSDNGQRENAWTHAPRMTETARLIVRPSPDLAYSSCVYDLTDGPVRISVQPWGDYMSLSLFAANTDNYYTLNDRRMPPSGAVVILRKAGQALTDEQTAAAFEVVDSPSTRGIALIRRLAPSLEQFAQADATRGREVCEALSAE
ncbi:MAG: DUF1254 domain-containing protein [Hyphomonadaceae bacterium]